MTQVNALIFSFTLSRFMKTKFIENYEELFQDRVRYGHSDKVIVLGGLIPGQSTNAVAALACELLDCNLLINISSFDKIMIRDQDNGRVGETVDFMTYDELWGEIKNFNQTPSNYDLFDHNAFSIVKRSNIPILFLSQHKDLNKILNDKKYDYNLSTDNCEGTIVWSREN